MSIYRIIYIILKKFASSVFLLLKQFPLPVEQLEKSAVIVVFQRRRAHVK